MAEVHIKGLDELKKKLAELPLKIEQNIVRGALRAGAKVIAEEAKRLCPVGTEDGGALRDSIRVSAQRTEKGKVKVAVKAGGGKGAGKGKAKDQVYYAHMVEFGTAAHFIKPKTSKSLFLAGLFKEGVNHPGAKAKPFMRPAMDGRAQDALQAVANYIAQRLPKEIEKLKK